MFGCNLPALYNVLSSTVLCSGRRLLLNVAVNRLGLQKKMFKFAAALAVVAPLAQLAAGQAQEWGQCGGIGWAGATSCGTYLTSRVALRLSRLSIIRIFFVH